ncbi:MAG: CDP-diacylglycerol diphosphatase [Steroidobacteraceae bacterium]|jgi:CDP-diacylglycerol pyrophosphatase
MWRIQKRVGAAGALAAALLAAPACGANPDALRQIVEEQCLVHWTLRHDPAPCVRVELADPALKDSGYALLADRKGGAHFLLIPTRRISGIESADLVLPGALNYLSSAWRARDRLESVVGHAIPRNAVGLAVNPVHARSQNQLHIHIECLRPEVRRALARAAGEPAKGWRTVRIGAYNLEALDLAGDNLDGQNPFKLLNEHILEDHGVVGEYTLVVAGTQSARGPGFILLTSPAVAGELLLDSTCAAASAPS